MNKRTVWVFPLVLALCLCASPLAREEDQPWRKRERPSARQEPPTPSPTPGGPQIIGHIPMEEEKTPLYDVPKITDVVTQEETAASRTLMPGSSMLSMEPLLQYPELPTGCESVALTMALKSLGYSLEKTTIAEEYLVYSDDNFALGYVGDPFSEEGAGVFPPGLVRTANAYLAAQSSSYKAYDASGLDLMDLLSFLASGHPVLLWVTMSYDEPSFSHDIADFEGRDYCWYWNEHCVALRGYDLTAGTLTLEDPLEGELVMDLEEMVDLSREIGNYAVVIR